MKDSLKLCLMVGFFYVIITKFDPNTSPGLWILGMVVNGFLFGLHKIFILQEIGNNEHDEMNKTMDEVVNDFEKEVEKREKEKEIAIKDMDVSVIIKGEKSDIVDLKTIMILHEIGKPSLAKFILKQEEGLEVDDSITIVIDGIREFEGVITYKIKMHDKIFAEAKNVQNKDETTRKDSGQEDKA